MTEPRERPILFSGSMVRAILDGSKTQTRRVVRAPHIEDAAAWRDDGGGKWSSGIEADHGRLGYGETIRCPYGTPGDRLWVRETWARYEDTNVWGSGIGSPVYRATWPPTLYERHDAGLLTEPKRWRPSIHMPRWASRITLEVTDVRVERVQDITPHDALSEGVDYLYRDDAPPDQRAVDAFAALWDTINAKRGYSWASNPWVWVVSFRKLPTGAEVEG